MKYIFYEKPKKIKILSQKKLEEYAELFPLNESMYIPFIEEEARNAKLDLAQLALQYDESLNEFSKNCKDYKYLGTYDYKNGDVIDFYLNDKYFFVALYKTVLEPNLCALFVNLIRNSNEDVI